MTHAHFGGRSARRGALVCSFAAALALAAPARAATNTTTIDLFGKSLFVLNRDAGSVTVFKIGKDDGLEKRVEIPVGNDPSCIAVRRASEAFVTNAADGTVAVVSAKGQVTKSIPVGAEPRGCALTPDGKTLYVANQTEGTVSVIDAKTKEVVDTVPVGGRPGAIAVTRDRVFVTQYFAELRPGGPGEGFDDGKQGIVQTFPVGDPSQLTEIVLSPLANTGFTANRANFCTEFNPTAVNEVFCPDVNETDPAATAIAQDPQGAFPNQLGAARTCGGRLYLPSIGASPEPPVLFNVNVQALVHVVDVTALAEIPAATVNLNNQIKTEAAPGNPTESLARLFGNDLVAIDSTRDCSSFFVLSRGGNYVLRASLDANGGLDIGAPDAVVRFQTGNIPSGIVVDPKGQRAFVNNEVNRSVSILDLESNTVIERDVPSSLLPAPGSFAHAAQLGKLVFFTALGVPDNGLVGKSVRDIVPLSFRGKQSDSAWSSCASCHPDGLADGVTWIFADGPRQSIPLDGLYSKLNGAHDTRINNWSAVRDSVTDFNNNSRNVQCGTGFAGGATNTAIGCPALGSGTPNPNIFDHGISQGASEALDLETTWVQTVRAPQLPKPADGTALDAGALLFEAQCATCHGGAKWTKSEVLYLGDPALDRAFAAGGAPRDPGLEMIANQSVSYADGAVDGGTLALLEDIGSFDSGNPIEIRQNGNAPLGSLGFNVPSLLGVAYHGPYFHNGAAQTLGDVFAQHGLGAGTISTEFTAQELDALLAFLGALDGRTPIFRSATDDFKEPLP